MARAACLLFVLIAAWPASAAEPDPIVVLYTDVLDILRAKPDDATAMLSLKPPTDLRNPGQRAALDAIVTHLKAAADQAPKSFGVQYNYYHALWTRHLYYLTADDAVASFEQLRKAVALTKVRSADRARCLFQLAKNAATLDPPLAKQVLGDAPRQGLIKLFLAAKRAAVSHGSYEGRSALALADLYLAEKNKAKAKEMAREALRVDTGRGYLTNHAYDCLGFILLGDGNVDGAVAMLEAAGAVQPDTDLASQGYACRLAGALIEKDRLKEPVDYLETVAELAREGKTVLTYDLAHTIATGYTKLGNSDRALMYWKQYIDMGDPNEARRKQAIETAHKLAIATTKPDGT